MVITSKIIKYIVLSAVGLFVFLVVAFLFTMFYESKKDISKDKQFAQYLNKPIVIKNIASIRWNKNQLRFSNYSLDISNGEDFDYGDVKTIKHYKIGDTIIFCKAMRYKNMHVGETYYLIARDTLNNNTPIEYEYYFQDKYFYNIWETEAEFLERIKTNQ